MSFGPSCFYDLKYISVRHTNYCHSLHYHHNVIMFTFTVTTESVKLCNTQINNTILVCIIYDSKLLLNGTNDFHNNHLG